MIHIPAYYQSLDLIPNLELMRLLKEEINWIQRKQLLIATLGHSPYKFSGVTYPAQPIPEFLQPLLNSLVEVSEIPFNTIHCNYYKDGSVGLGRHQDNEPEHTHDDIVSISLGETRHFIVNNQTISLADGDLVHFNRYEYHSVPKQPKVTGERISLTFRVFK